MQTPVMATQFGVIQRTTFLALLAVIVTAASGATPTVPRGTIIAEPAYSSAPKYCLITFGADANTKIWLVLDGSSLYVDRNADGNLTEPSKHIAMEPAQGSGHLFKVGNVHASADGKKQAQLLVERYGDLILLTADIAPQLRQIAGTDPSGNLQFSDSADKAPVVHFDAPLTLQTNGDSLHRGHPTDLYAMVGTPGSGPGTFAALLHAGIDKDVHIEAELEVSRKGVAEPDRRHVVLNRRCCGCLFHAPVNVARDAGDLAKVSLTFENLHAGQVATAQVEVKITSTQENSAGEDAILNGSSSKRTDDKVTR